MHHKAVIWVNVLASCCCSWHWEGVFECFLHSQSALMSCAIGGQPIWLCHCCGWQTFQRPHCRAWLPTQALCFKKIHKLKTSLNSRFFNHSPWKTLFASSMFVCHFDVAMVNFEMQVFPTAPGSYHGKFDQQSECVCASMQAYQMCPLICTDSWDWGICGGTRKLQNVEFDFDFGSARQWRKKMLFVFFFVIWIMTWTFCCVAFFILLHFVLGWAMRFMPSNCFRMILLSCRFLLVSATSLLQTRWMLGCGCCQH